MSEQSGMSLISLMVGIFIGLVVSLAVINTASFVEAQRRMSTGGNAALSSAADGLFVLEKTIRQAGLGLMASNGFACPSLNLAYNGTAMSNGGAVYPVSVMDGGNGSDQISIAYLDSLLSAAAPRLLLPQANPDADMLIANMMGIAPGTVLLLQSMSGTEPCTLMQASAVTASSPGATVAHVGGAINTASASYATPVTYQDNDKAAPANAFKWLTYRVNTNPTSPDYLTLEEVDNTTGTVTVVAEDIVAMQIQYGVVPPIGSVTAPADSVITWTDAVDNSALAPPANVNWTAPTAADMLRVRAIRLAIVAKSQDPDHTGTAVCSSTAPNRAATQYPQLVAWSGLPPTGNPLVANSAVDGPTVDLAAVVGANWCHYRYRVVSLMLPLLNVKMGG